MSIFGSSNDYLIAVGFTLRVGGCHGEARSEAEGTAIPAGASVCWFDVPANDLGRAKKFYGSLFDWKFAKLSAAVADYWHIDTGGKDASPDDGLLPRMHPGHTIMVYVTVPSIDKAVAKVQKLGGTVCKQKTAVPRMGYFVICDDTEHNAFALWEMNQRAA